MESRWTRAVVVGASSGIGEALARRLAGSGCLVALVARREPALQHICNEINREAGASRARFYVHDVRDWEEAEPLLQRIAADLEGLDLVVYCAGVLPAVGPAAFPTAVDVVTIQTNFTGAVAWLNAAAHRFATSGRGTIVGISSIAGERGRRTNPVYQATKAALNTYLESLRARLATAGITVLTVKPGYVRTSMTSGAAMALPAISADEAAEAILSAAASRKRSVFVPGWWRLVALAVRAIPAPLFERLPVP